MSNSTIDRARKADKATHNISELTGMAKMAIADGKVTSEEADTVRAFLAQASMYPSPLIENLIEDFDRIYADGIVDDEEKQELFELFSKLAGDPSTLGEMAKSSNLPLCDPPPPIRFEGSRFCLTGTFGSQLKRSGCEKVIRDRGGVIGGIAKSTDYLVIGEYATSSWKHSSMGNKILKAMAFRDDEGKPAIVSEGQFLSAL
ncbi:NAD-dependent DNA ligase [gamma proteobacterium HIMB55]|nr:NAD-dependent DNA ligase [gamma proteobacterium HIMB55]